MRFFRFDSKTVDVATDYDSSGLLQQFALDRLLREHGFSFHRAVGDKNVCIFSVYDSSDKKNISEQYFSDIIFHTDRSLANALVALKRHPFVISLTEVFDEKPEIALVKDEPSDKDCGEGYFTTKGPLHTYKAAKACSAPKPQTNDKDYL
jgi:hypothetical protein